jgi:hypothetical protein
MSPNDYASSLPRAAASSRWPQTAANPLNFCLLGLVYASWAARVPAVRDALRLDAADLSIALLGGGASAMQGSDAGSAPAGHPVAPG